MGDQAQHGWSPRRTIKFQTNLTDEVTHKTSNRQAPSDEPDERKELMGCTYATSVEGASTHP